MNTTLNIEDAKWLNLWVVSFVKTAYKNFLILPATIICGIDSVQSNTSKKIIAKILRTKLKIKIYILQMIHYQNNILSNSNNNKKVKSI